MVADDPEPLVDVGRVAGGREVLGAERLEPVPVEGVLQVLQGQGVVENVDGRLKHHLLHLRYCLRIAWRGGHPGPDRASVVLIVLIALRAAGYETMNGPAISSTSSIVSGVSKAAGKGISPVSRLR